MKLERQDGVGILTIDTPRNNAVNPEFIRESLQLLDEAEGDDRLRALVVTSTHPAIFCPGVDLPSLIACGPPEIRAFFEGMAGLVRRSFAFPKPQVYALSGHAIAVGCFMALTGDYRIMARGQFYIGLIMLDLGLAAPVGVVEMASHVLGMRTAERLLRTAEVYLPEQGLGLGLVDEVVERELLMTRAVAHARFLGDKPAGAYGMLKRYSRHALAERMRLLDAAHVDDLVSLWFTEETQRRLVEVVERITKKAGASARPRQV